MLSVDAVRGQLEALRGRRQVGFEAEPVARKARERQGQALRRRFFLGALCNAQGGRGLVLSGAPRSPPIEGDIAGRPLVPVCILSSFRLSPPTREITVNSTRFLRSAWALPVLCLSANPQSQGPDSADLPPVPVQVVDLGDPIAPGANQTSEPVFGGEPNRYDTAETDDAVPAPEPAVVEPGPNGDRVVVPAGGDPYFLGFAAGRYYPPAGEKVDPTLNQVLAAHYSDGRPAQQTYVFVMFEKRITQARIAAIEATGARVLGFHPHHTLKVALGIEQIDNVATLDFVRWVGLPKTWQKIHPNFVKAAQQLGDGQLMEAWISVYDSDLNAASVERTVGVVEAGGPEGVVAIDAKELLPREFDSNGWQQRELERLGVTALNFDPDIRAFRVRLAPAVAQDLANLDFVQFIESRGIPTLVHDESMPMINADYTRTSYDGNTNLAAIAGQADSGLKYSHTGLTGFTWWSSNLTGSSESSTDDLCGHGSHVAGTIHGNTSVDDSYEGAANALGWGATGRYFNTKIFYSAGCFFGGSTVATILGSTDSAVTDSNGFVTPRPHVLNHSWGTPIFGSIGSEADCRTIDNSVYNNQQLQVWAAGNDGPGASTLSVESSAKNAFTVGNVKPYIDGSALPGTINSGSSRGPCGDGRWKPNVVAPGTAIFSIDADTSSGYINKSGTSMAAPHVTGVAAQLVDHIPFLRYNPATLGALLMGTAMTKDNVELSTPNDSHLDNYGTGRIEAYKAHFGSSQQALFYWGYTQNASGYSDVDFTVNAGATRVVAVLHYIEVASSAGASKAQVNDFSMYLDQPPLTAGGNTGDWVAQQSNLNNTEIRIIDNPVTGAWKLKVWPTSVTNTVHVGLTVSVIYGDTTPLPTLAVSASDSFVQPNQSTVISADLTNPSYIAGGVALTTLATGETITTATGVLADGSTASYMNNFDGGAKVTIGNLRHGQTRGVDWGVRWATEGVKTFNVQSESDNALDTSVTVNVTVDGTAPATISGLGSSTHQTNVVSCQQLATIIWNTPTDALSGVAGVSYLWNQTSNSTPDTVIDLAGTPTSVQVNVGPSGPWYFHIRSIDKSGNTGLTSHAGPNFYDATPVTTYCTSLVSSGGCVPTIGSSGLPSLTAPAGFTVTGSNLQAGMNGLLFFGTTGQNNAPFFGGTLCVAGTLYRLPVKNAGGAPTCGGSMSYTLADFLAHPSGGPQVTLGATANCQVWFRDPPAAQTVGLTNGLEFLVCP